MAITAEAATEEEDDAGKVDKAEENEESIANQQAETSD